MSKTMRFAIPTALVLVAALGAGAAQARTDVQWSVTIGAPVYAVPAPVYVQPRPVYYEPAPVYYPPAPVYYQPRPVYRVVRSHGPSYWDRDGDGIPNRYDRVYNPVWDRDGDGVPNRYDRHPRDGWRR
jgi:PXPV repeat (3 copies)